MGGGEVGARFESRGKESLATSAAMQVDPVVREHLLDPVLAGSLSVHLDDFVLKTPSQDVPLVASMTSATGRNGFEVRLRDGAGRDLRQFFPRKSKYDPSDTVEASGIAEGAVPISIRRIWPPSRSITRPIGQPKTSRAFCRVSAIEVLSDDEDASSLFDNKSPFTHSHLAIFANVELQFRNGSARVHEDHGFWGKRSESKFASWDGSAFGGEFSIRQAGNHLEVGLRHAAVDAKEACARFEALLLAVSYTHGINPWPVYERTKERGRIISQRIWPRSQLQGSFTPLRERHGFEYPSAPTDLIRAVAEWSASLPEGERANLNHQLWVLRNADHPCAPIPTQLTMIGAIVEGLSQPAEEIARPPAFDAIKKDVLAWAKAEAECPDDQERAAEARGLIGYLKGWKHESRRRLWNAAFEPLFPGKEKWVKEIFKLYQAHRHSPAHGDFVKSTSGDPHALLEAQGRLSAFINAVIAAKAGYCGPLVESTCGDALVTVGSQSPERSM